MFGDLSHLVLQQYWWIIVSLLGALLVLLMFVQGGQTLIYTLGKQEIERTMLVNSLGRKWEFTFTTLVTFGGAFFASFPLFYSTSFGGAYWVWMAILFAFVIQAVSYEFRTKANNFLGAKTFEAFLFINGALGTILIGTAVATFFTGAEFSVNEMNFSQWETPFHGLEAVWTTQNLAFLQNISLGLAVFFLARVLGVLYFMNNINDDGLKPRFKRSLIVNTIPFLVFFLFFVIRLMFIDGFAVNPQTKEVYMQANKYLTNFLEMPAVFILFLVGVVAVLLGIARPLMNMEKCATKGIWLAGAGTVFTVLALLLNAGFNNTAYYPSTFDLQSSLTIENSSSSHFTLTVMSYVSLLVPFVVAYIWIAWRAINNKPIDRAEMEANDHVY